MKKHYVQVKATYRISCGIHDASVECCQDLGRRARLAQVPTVVFQCVLEYASAYPERHPFYFILPGQNLASLVTIYLKGGG